MPTFLNLPFAHLALNNNRSLYSRHWDKGKNDCLLRSIELYWTGSCITRCSFQNFTCRGYWDL